MTAHLSMNSNFKTTFDVVLSLENSETTHSHDTKASISGVFHPTFPESSHVTQDFSLPDVLSLQARKLLPFLAQQPVQQAQPQMCIELTSGQKHLQKLCSPNPMH